MKYYDYDGQIFMCPKLNEETFVKQAIKIETESYPCESCFSHGSETLVYVCDCGDTHKVEVREW